MAKGAGDLYVNSLGAVLNRKPSEAFYPMGDRSNNMAEQLGYWLSITISDPVKIAAITETFAFGFRNT